MIFAFFRSAILFDIQGVLHRQTSRLKSTPPMGEPKATLIPEAAAAESTSRFRAVYNVRHHVEKLSTIEIHTLVLIDDGEQFDEEIRATTGHMHQRTFFTQPHSRRHSQTLRRSQKIRQCVSMRRGSIPIQETLLPKSRSLKIS